MTALDSCGERWRFLISLAWVTWNNGRERPFGGR